MLRIKDRIGLQELEEFGFVNPSNTQHLWKYTLWDGGIVRIWIDRYRYLHYNAPTQKTFDLIYKMHNLLEIDDNNDDLRALSRPVLLEENEKLKEEIKQLKYTLDSKNLNLSYKEIKNE